MIKNQAKLIQYVAAAAAVCVFGLSFDGFWHLTRGRESFFALPHLFVYGGLLAALNFAWHGFKLTNSSPWRWLLRSLAAIPLAAPLDEIWHKFFGKESIESPLIVWSPPHLIFLFAAMFSLLIVARMIHSANNIRNKNFLGPAVIGLFLNVFIITLMPLHPISPQSLLGASGLGIISVACLSAYFYTRRLFPEFGSATLTGLVLATFQMVVFDANYYLSDSFNFFHLPDWTLFLIYVLPAILVDSTDKWYGPSRGMAIGIVFGLLFFGIGGTAPNSPYTYGELWGGAIASAIGGILAGFMFETMMPDKKKTA